MAIEKTFGQFFSPEYFVTGNTGKHVDNLRAADMPYYSDQPVMGYRRTIIWNERTVAFDKFAAEAAELKRRQDMALMIRLMGEI